MWGTAYCPTNDPISGEVAARRYSEIVRVGFAHPEFRICGRYCVAGRHGLLDAAWLVHHAYEFGSRTPRRRPSDGFTSWWQSSECFRPCTSSSHGDAVGDGGVAGA